MSNKSKKEILAALKQVSKGSAPPAPCEDGPETVKTLLEDLKKKIFTLPN